MYKVLPIFCCMVQVAVCMEDQQSLVAQVQTAQQLYAQAEKTYNGLKRVDAQTILGRDQLKNNRQEFVTAFTAFCPISLHFLQKIHETKAQELIVDSEQLQQMAKALQISEKATETSLTKILYARITTIVVDRIGSIQSKLYPDATTFSTSLNLDFKKLSEVRKAYDSVAHLLDDSFLEGSSSEGTQTEDVASNVTASSSQATASPSNDTCSPEPTHSSSSGAVLRSNNRHRASSRQRSSLFRWLLMLGKKP